MDGGWKVILDILVVLSSALVFGLVFERLKLSWIAGCLVAGVVIGPTVLRLVDSTDAARMIAEIGVALLLFAIGLEFSVKDLLALGWRPAAAAALSILLFCLLGAGAGQLAGLGLTSGIALGAAVSLGSTAVVLRVLKDRNDLDAGHGRTTLGILLVQDIALVPLVLLVTLLGQGGGLGEMASGFGLALLKTVGLVIGLTLFVSLVVPRLLDDRIVAKNRELPIIMGTVTCIGATWAAHELKISPALGAFFAGILLATSRYSDQLRADVLPLRTLFVTFFFVSIGLLVDASWVMQNAALVLAGGLGMAVLKVLVHYATLRPFRSSILESLAASLCLAQVGEFSFVLAGIAVANNLFSRDVLQFLVSSTVLTILLTPFLAGNAASLARRIAKRIVPARKLAGGEREQSRVAGLSGHAIVIGFGDAGQAAAATLRRTSMSVLVIDYAPPLVSLAEQRGYKAMIGDATSHEILTAAGVDRARSAVAALPDWRTAQTVVGVLKSLAPGLIVVARSRYHHASDLLDIAGADFVVDEEKMVGTTLGRWAGSDEILPARETP
ncbi:MAG: cation:proton antiporter [Fimbriimonadaceae bacterium]|nr:cation:proton antiporter [Fimbriimonadaceae bacterium]